MMETLSEEAHYSLLYHTSSGSQHKLEIINKNYVLKIKLFPTSLNSCYNEALKHILEDNCLNFLL